MNKVTEVSSLELGDLVKEQYFVKIFTIFAMVDYEAYLQMLNQTCLQSATLRRVDGWERDYPGPGIRCNVWGVLSSI